VMVSEIDNPPRDIPRLFQLAKSVVVDNLSLYSMKGLRTVVRSKLIPASELGLNENSVALPIRGRRIVVREETSTEDGREETKKSKANKFTAYREVCIKSLTVSALKAAVAARWKRDAKDIKRIFSEESDRLIEVEEDDQLEEFTDHTCTYGFHLHSVSKGTGSQDVPSKN